MVFHEKSIVKNTTILPIRSVFDLISPPLCRGCGRREGYLCERCKKYISTHVKPRGLFRDFPEAKKIFLRAEYLGFRDEILGELVEEYKYESVRGLAREIAEIIFLTYISGKPEFSKGVILCPMPTSRKHIRERGFDHIRLVTKELEKIGRREGVFIRTVRLIERAKDTTQVGASEEIRRKQAKDAVRISGRFSELFVAIPNGVKVVLFDDVWTTGASMIEAGKILRKAGVSEVFGMTIVKNRYQKSPLIRRGELF